MQVRRRWSFSLLAVLATALAASAAAEERDGGIRNAAAPGISALSKSECAPYSGDEWKPWGLRSTCEVVREVAAAKGAFADAVAHVAKEYGLPQEAARSLVAAELELESVRRFSDDSKAASARAVADARAAIAAAPSHPVPYLWLLTNGYLVDFREADLEAAIAAAPQPVPLAVSLLADASRCAELAKWVLSRDLGQLDTVLARIDIDAGSGEPWLYFRALEVALTRKPPPPYLGRLARAVISDLLDEGLSGLALEIYGSLPAATRAQVSAAAAPDAGADSGPDVRRGLALAMVAKGDLDGARAIAGKLPEGPISDDPVARGRSSCVARARALALKWHLEPSQRESTYQLAVDVQTCATELDPEGLVGPLSKTYPDVLRNALEDGRLRLVQLANKAEKATDHPELFGELRPRIGRAAQAQVERIRAEEEQVARAPAGPPDPMAATIQKLLQADVPQVWSEHPLPKDVAPSDGKRRPAKLAVDLPRGFWPVRVEKAGKTLWVVALSQSADPTGEVSAGAYWILRTRDGKSWDRPLYTGLRHYQPYEIVTTSKLPMISGKMIRLETRIRELDPKTITFPPIGLTPKREASGLYLEASIDALEKDSDGDQLTDLLELRLLTDPSSRDTDGDGFEDAEDPFPTVPLPKEEPPATADLLSIFFAEVTGAQMPGLVVGLPDKPSKDDLRLPKGHAPVGEDPVLYVEGDRRQFVGVRAPLRIIVLSPDEVAQAKKRFGVFYPFQLQLTIDEKNGRALIIYDEGWRGGSFTAERKDGRWVLTNAGSWIT